MSSNNRAVIKIIGGHAKEMNELSAKYEKACVKLLDVQKKYAEVLDEKTNVDALVKKLKKDNKDLRAIVVRFERDNVALQESLDYAQREIERLNEEWELVVKRDLG